MSNATPTDRKNHLVWDQMELGQYKQALQLCNRRIKKGDKSEYLLALKAFVLTHFHNPTSIDEASQIARGLSDQTPPTSSVDVLRLLTRTWTKLGHLDEVTKLWERAVKAQPKNEELAREWFWGTIRAMDWRGAQKAAMSLQKLFTKRREYWFWAVVSSLLLHNTLPDDTPERKLFGTLAHRMIDKARKDTPVDTTLIPPRAIQTSQEVHLLLELLQYVDTGDSKQEALDVLNSTNLGVDSTIGGGDWWGLARKRLDLLQESRQWRSLFENCKKLLPENERAATNTGGSEDDNCPGKDQSKESKGENLVQGRSDDWRVWDGFVLAAGKLYDDSDKAVAKESLDKILDHRRSYPSGSRHGDLALVKFSSLFHDKNDGPEGTPTLLEAAEEYFMKTGNKNCCFEDLQIYLEMLEDSEKMEFLKYVEAAVKDIPEADEQKKRIDKTACSINHQKFIYLLTISPLSSASSAIANTISAFVTNTLKIYASSLSLGTSLLTTDNQYGDDAALLSVMGLVRLYTLTPSNQSLLYQSIQILETLLQKSKHNYQALLILLRIYLLVGAIGRALDIYPRLNIKQIQNDTLSHYLLTRISTLLPNDARTPTFLRDAGGIYETSRSQTPNMIQLGFERGGYGQMMGFLQFSERVSGSICRTMYQIELRRLSRMSPGYPSPGSVEEVGHKGTLWDNRDFTVVMDCELSPVGSFERSFRLGPTPGENWIRAFAAVEEIVDFLIPSSATVKEENVASNGDGNSGAEKHTLPTDVAGRIAHGLEAGNKAGEKNKEFTASEIAYLMLSGAIAELCYAAVNKDGTTVATVLEGISTLLMPATLDSLDTPDWNLLHALWMTKDSCSLIEATVRFLSTAKGIKPNLPKSKISALGETAKKYRKKVAMKAREAQQKLGNDKLVQALVDNVLVEQGVGSVLQNEQIFGGVEKVAGNVRETLEDIRKCFEGI